MKSNWNWSLWKCASIAADCRHWATASCWRYPSSPARCWSWATSGRAQWPRSVSPNCGRIWPTWYSHKTSPSWGRGAWARRARAPSPAVCPGSVWTRCASTRGPTWTRHRTRHPPAHTCPSPSTPCVWQWHPDTPTGCAATERSLSDASCAPWHLYCRDLLSRWLCKCKLVYHLKVIEILRESVNELNH